MSSCIKTGTITVKVKDIPAPSNALTEIYRRKKAELLAKPHLGTLENWSKYYYTNTDYVVMGIFMDHPRFHDMRGHTSLVISHDEETDEIETLDSRYTLGEPLNRTL